MRINFLKSIFKVGTKYMYRPFILTCVLSLVGFTAYAGSVELTQRLNKSSMAQDANIKVKDPFLRSVYPEVNYSSKVSLIYGRQNRTDLESKAPWSLTVNYTLTFYDDNFIQAGSPVTGNTLTIDFNHSNPTYEAVQLFNTSAHNYGNVKLTVNSVSPGAGQVMADIPNDVQLELTLINQSQFNLGATQLFGYKAPDKTLYWSYLLGADSYQTEWVYIDDEDQHSPFVTQQDPFLYKEPVRINTSNQHYVLNHTLSNGVVYFRVRGVGKFVGSESNSQRYSAWTYLASPVTTQEFEKNKNWQCITGYTEDGNYKKAMTFFDGSMRGRQVATNLSSDNNVLVGETKYDYEGRAVVSVLPVPISGSSLSYIPALNVFTTPSKGKNSYDNNSVNGPESLATTSGASHYYSSNNNVETLHKDYIPSANGYPFSQVEFTRDGTGRIARQSMVGDIFKLQDPTLGAKYVRNFYNTTNATELKRLFGNNVGHASHYQKNAVIDANGQVSVSYTDQEGRVIATALAGDAPGNLNLVKYTDSENNVVGYADSENIVVNLDENNEIDRTNYVSKSTTTIMNTVQGTVHTFNYNLTGVINHAEGFPDVCKECTYDLKISVKDPDGLELPGSPVIKTDIKPASVNCTTDVSYPDNIPEVPFTFAKLGNYTIVKELSLSSGAITTLVSSLSEQPGFPTLSTYTSTYLARVDKSKCDFTCEDHCRSDVQAANPTWDPASPEFISALNTCVSTNCPDIIDNVITDVSNKECESLLQQMQDQIGPGNIYPAIVDVVNHPEYCHYLACITPANIASDIYDKKMPLAKSMSEATAKGYLPDPTTNDPYFAGGSHATERTYIQGKLNAYFDEAYYLVDANGDLDMTDVLTLEQFAGTYVPHSSSPSYIPSSEQQWSFIRGIYSGLKKEKQREVLISTCGPYLDSPDAVVTDPALPSTVDEANEFNDQNTMESCAGTCQENALLWLSMLQDTDHCGPLSETHYNEVLGKLLEYCSSNCGYQNPFGYLIKEDIAVNADLQEAQIILNSYGCNLESIAISNPYTLACQEVTKRTLTPCAYQVIGALKKHIVQVNNDNYTYADNCPAESMWKPEEISKVPFVDGDIYSAFYSVKKECNYTDCDYGYVMMSDDRRSGASLYDIRFLWGNADGQYAYYGICSPADQYQEPVTCGVNHVYLAKFFTIDNGVKNYIEKTKILDIHSPAIDFQYSFGGDSWDNQNVGGVTVKVLLDNGNGTTLLKTAYIETNYASPFIVWKTDYSPTNPGMVCSPISVSPCPVNPEKESALHLDGTDDYVECNNDPELNITGAITLEAWIKPDAIHTGMIASKHCTNSNRSYDLHLSGNQVIFEIIDNADNLYLLSASNINAGTWYHVAGTYNPATGDQKLYVDGIQVSSATIGSKTIMTSTVPFAIGAYYGLAGNCLALRDFFDGSIDDVRVWNIERTQTEIQSSMNCPMSQTPAGLVGYWNFDEGMGVRANDATSNANHGRLYNNINMWEDATSPVANCNGSCPETSATASVTVPNQVGGNSAEILPNPGFEEHGGGWYLSDGSLIDPITSSNGKVDLTNFSGQYIKTGNILTVGKKYKLYYNIGNLGYYPFKQLQILNGNAMLAEHSTSNMPYQLTFVATAPYLAFSANHPEYTTTPAEIGSLGLYELYPSFDCLNVHENGEPLLNTCVSFNTDGTTTATQLVSALNAVPSDYTFTRSGVDIIATGKPGTGASLNGRNISIVGITNSPYKEEILSEGLVEGGKNVGDCCEDVFTFPVDWQTERAKCIALLEDIAVHNAYEDWQNAVSTFTSNYLEQHFNKCFDAPFKEVFTCSYALKEYHYTLYHYDQAGNLVMTLPPQAVQPLTQASFPALNDYKYNGDPMLHNMNFATKYKYDGVNSLVYQKTPDGGESYFWYDSKGRMRLSQNAQQLTSSNTLSNPNDYIYSYTRYDKLGRISDVGQIEDLNLDKDYLNATANAKDVYALLDDLSFPQGASQLAQRTITFYDKGEAEQENLRGRVSKVIMKETAASTESQTLYSYDEHGNVQSLTQKITGLPDKKADYEYDLISRKVTKLYYQKGQSDQFIHAYKYDADNRLTKVRTSADGYIWEEDAAYFYSKTGVLARTELGEDKVQGLDYYYTLQGWIKGTNIPDSKQLFGGRYKVNNDQGRDGFVISGNLNQYVAQDEFAYNLGYYNGDYTPINPVSLGAGGSNNWNVGQLKDGILQNGLYNGNISLMVTQVHALGYNTPDIPVNNPDSEKELFGLSAYAFQYDQLNRITHGRNYRDYASASWTGRNPLINSEAYDVYYDYDKNGNIMHANVNGKTAAKMDELSYDYTLSSGIRLNNKLNYVTDLASTGAGATDIENQTSTNYGYDAIGNLIKDESEMIETIKWTVYGKVKEVIRTTAGYNAGKANLVFTYDGAGNRIKKEVLSNSGATTAYYVRDVSGNLLAVHENSASVSSIEYSIYGSSRVGNYMVDNAIGLNVLPYKRQLGRKQYELTNHLGNVLAAISDLKLGVDTSGEGSADYYKVITRSGNNYYAFGMLQEGRNYNLNEYRYGFQGQEKDDEIKGSGNSIDFKYRMHDPRLGRFFAVDPLATKFPYNSPYAFAENDVISSFELEGLEKIRVTNYSIVQSAKISNQFEKKKIVLNTPVSHSDPRQKKLEDINNANNEITRIINFGSETGAPDDYLLRQLDKNGVETSEPIRQCESTTIVEVIDPKAKYSVEVNGVVVDETGKLKVQKLGDINPSQEKKQVNKEAWKSIGKSLTIGVFEFIISKLFKFEVTAPYVPSGLSEDEIY